MPNRVADDDRLKNTPRIPTFEKMRDVYDMRIILKTNNVNYCPIGIIRLYDSNFFSGFGGLLCLAYQFMAVAH